MPDIRKPPTGGFNRRLIMLFLITWAASCIRVPYPDYFALQHVPTVLALVTLTAIDRKVGIDRLSYALIVWFLLLHLIGARYLYSYVPYDDWTQKLFGFRVTDQFGFERNHYDRLVHFAFGFLFVYPLCRLLEEHTALARRWTMALAVCVVLAASAVYEIIEWGMAATLAPDWAEAYNGQQGDVWDAQRDMALAWGGSILAVALMSVHGRRQ
jgi:putative membrane protein